MSRDPMLSEPAPIEGLARVVAVEGRLVWLEPEPGASCAGCAAVGACGDPGLGTAANRLRARRFSLAAAPELAVGERVVVGVDEHALLQAAALAYALPLAAALTAAGLAQWLAGSDALSLLAALLGLGAGLAGARVLSRGMQARGQLTPRLLRRAGGPLTPARTVSPPPVR